MSIISFSKMWLRFAVEKSRQKKIIGNPCIKSMLRIFSSDQTNAQTISFRRIPALIYLKTKNIEEKSWKILLNFIDFLKLMMWDMLLAFQPELLSTKIPLNLKMTFYLKTGDFSIVLIYCNTVKPLFSRLWAFQM